MSATDAIGSERLEALLRGAAPRTAAEERRAALLDGLRAGTLRAPEALRARVLAAGPATQRRARLAWPSRRLAFVAVPTALALVVVAALVHGVTDSGPPAAGPQPMPAVRHGIAAGGSGGASSAAAPSLNAAPARGLPPVATGTRLQHAEASLEVRVADDERLSQATSKATRIVTSLGGYAQSVRFTSASDGGGGTAQLDLRVPAADVRTAVGRLEALGTVVSQSLSEQDLQHLFAAQSQRIAQLRRRAAALAKAVANPALPEAQRVLLRIRLAEARRSLAQALAARKGTVSSAADANVSLLLETQTAAAAVPHRRGRLGRMLHSAAGFLALEGTIALYALVVLSPLLVLAALAWWGVRLRRRRDERRLLAA